MQTPIGEMWLDDDGVLWHRIDAMVVTAEAARKVREVTEHLTGGRPTPAVIDIRAVGYAGAEARDVFNTSPGEASEIATALVVESSSSQAMARLFVNITKPERPVRVFTSVEEAAAWARTFVDDDRSA